MISSQKSELEVKLNIFFLQSLTKKKKIFTDQLTHVIIPMWGYSKQTISYGLPYDLLQNTGGLVSEGPYLLH